MSKTISQALKDLFLGLGGKSSELSDNTTISDYIEDLTGAIKDASSAAAASIIDDTEASEEKTFSSSKITSLIPANELPTPSSTNEGKVATVVSDGAGGYVWGAGDVLPSVESNFNRVLTVNLDANNNIAWVPGLKMFDLNPNIDYAGKTVIINSNSDGLYFKDTLKSVDLNQYAYTTISDRASVWNTAFEKGITCRICIAATSGDYAKIGNIYFPLTSYDKTNKVAIFSGICYNSTDDKYYRAIFKITDAYANNVSITFAELT